MGDWIVMVIMACVTINGESKNQEIGLAINKQSELIIIIPEVLDIHLKRKGQVNDFALFADKDGKLYSLFTIYRKDEFVFFLSEVERKPVSEHNSSRRDSDAYIAVQSFV